MPGRWAVDFTVYFTLVWGWSESHPGLSSAGSAMAMVSSVHNELSRTRGRGRCARGVPRSGFPYPETSWATSGPLTQGHRPLDDKLRGRHCISGSAPAPSMAVSLPVSMRSWRVSVPSMGADALLGGHLSPCTGLSCDGALSRRLGSRPGHFGAPAAFSCARPLLSCSWGVLSC